VLGGDTLKTKVIVSSDCGVEAIPEPSILGILPDEIHFSPVEIYKNASEMDFYAFDLRLKYDSNANPEIKGCSEEVLRDILEDFVLDGHDRFYFILSSKKLEYYKPLIEKYVKENHNVQYFYYIVKSEGLPVAYMAKEAQKMFFDNKSIPEIEKALAFYDSKNAIFLYSPLEDKTDRIEKYSSEDEGFEISGNNSIMYFIRKSDSSFLRLKEKNKTINPYIDVLLLEMDGKKVVPFVLYTNERSLYTKAFVKELEKSFPDLKIPCFEMPPQMVLKYGKYSIAMGYIEKYDKEA
jgi:fatty acid-binding protein DegV